MTRLVCLAAAAVVTAGCASASATGPGSLDGAASIVPASATAFVAASTDLDAPEWHSIGAPLVRQYDALRPALGDELDVAVLPAGQVVAFTRPDDAKQLDALARRRGYVTRTIGGWTAVAKTQAVLDTVATAKTHLAQSARFTEAMERLPGDALVRAYASGDRTEQLIGAIPGQMEMSVAPSGMRYRFRSRPRQLGPAVADAGFRWGSAALTSRDGGFEVEAFAQPGVLTSPGAPRYVVHAIAPYRPGLVDEIPAGALAVVDVMLPAGTFETLPRLPAALQKLFAPTLAPELPLRLDTLLGGETALYVRPSLPTPEVTLVTQPADTDAAQQALDILLNGAVQKPKLYRAVIGGQLVLSTTQKGIDDFRSGGPRLSADPAFVEAAKRAKMPELTTGFAYADLKTMLPLLRLAGLKLPAGLPRLGTFLAYGAKDGGQSTFTAVVGPVSS
jgi:hypothetical protein